MSPKAIALTALLAAPVIPSAGAGPFRLRFERDSEADVPAKYVYDPVTRRSAENASSRRFGRPTAFPVGRVAGSFTLEAFVKIDRDPKRTVTAAALGGHAVGARFLPRWNQTYWAGLSPAAAEPAWSTGHYVTISRLVDPVKGRHAGTLAWRHLALVYDHDKKTMTCWLDRWQRAAQAVVRGVELPGTLTLGGRDGAAYPGLIDEVRLTPRALRPWQFLLACDTPLNGVDLRPRPGPLPADAGHFDVRAHFGAVGDGKHDDTGAFRYALNHVPRSSIVYVPDGTYLVSGEISWLHFRGLRGQSRDGTVIKLKDHCPGYGLGAAPPRAVLRCHYNRNESIANFIQGLTVDTGVGNPGAIGVRFNCHNQGACEDVRIRSGDGAGRIGLDLSEDEFGPALITRVEIDGFDVGIRTPGNVSHATLEDISLKNQRVAGIDNRLPMSIHRLRSENAVPAVRNGPGWMAQLTLIDAELTGGEAKNAAIVNRSTAYCRNVRVAGYGAALEAKDGTRATGPIAEYVSGKTASALSAGPHTHLKLPVEDPPTPHREPAAAWRGIDGSAADDTAAVQAAIDSGAETVYFKFGQKYEITDTVHVRGAVRRIVGMNAGVHGDPKIFGRDKPMFRFDGPGRHPVTVEHLSPSTYPKPGLQFEIATRRTVSFRHCHGQFRNTEAARGAKLFLTGVMGRIDLRHPQRAWVRQFNPETHAASAGGAYLTNRGGVAWVLGMKTEGVAVHAVTTAGGRTEILGGFFRDHNGSQGVPYFRTVDASLSANYLQYAWRRGAARSLQAVEAQGGRPGKFTVEPANAVIGLYRARGKKRPR